MFKYKLTLPLCCVCLLIIFYSSLSTVLVSGQGALTPTPTAAKSLEEQLGFSHPVLTELQQYGVRQVGEDVKFTAYGQQYRLVSFSPIPVPAGDGNRFDLGTVLLFQVNGTSAKLLWRKYMGSGWAILDSRNSEGHKWPSPGDWEQNGTVSFGVFYGHDSTCPASPLDVYALTADGIVSSRFQNVVPQGHTIHSVEVSENGSLLLIGTDRRGQFSQLNAVSCTGPQIDRFFELRGKLISEVSSKHESEYYQRLGALVYILTIWEPNKYIGFEADAIWFSAKLMELLMIYDALGKRQEGYILMQSLATTAIESGRVKQKSYLDQVFLPTMAQLYEKNLPFIPPDFVGPDARQPSDYYK